MEAVLSEKYLLQKYIFHKLRETAVWVLLGPDQNTVAIKGNSLNRLESPNPLAGQRSQSKEQPGSYFGFEKANKPLFIRMSGPFTAKPQSIRSLCWPFSSLT